MLKRLISIRSWLFFLALFVLTAMPIFAALTGDIQGTVFDPKGLVISGAKVTIRNLGTGATREVNTDALGQFTAQQLDLGTYEVRVETQGFRTYSGKAEVRSGEVIRLTITLELGPAAQVLTVEASAGPVLDVADAQLSISIDAKTVKELPNLNRDPVVYATLSPGVVPVTKDNPFLGSGSFNSNGQRGRANNITVDNITATDIATTGSSGVGTFSLDAVQEFKLITNSFAAEFGRNAGAQVQIITKGGTNEYHGTAYWFHQNAALNARDFFDTTGRATPFIQNQWGFVAGGPIIKEHLFAFGHYEGIKTRGAGSTATANVLTPTQAAGITDPTAAALFQAVGAPTSATGRLSSSASNAGDQYSWSLRIDETWRAGKDSISARYGANPVTLASPSLTFIQTNLPNFGATVIDTDRAFYISETHVFGPAVVNQFRFAFGRGTPIFPPNTTLQPPFAPFFVISGFDALGVSRLLPQGRVQNISQASDAVSWAVGRHALKVGADVFRYQANDFFDADFRGRINFSDVPSFQGGTPSRWRQRFGTSVRGNRATDVFFYGQDDIRVTPTFTANLGLRVESSGGVSEVNGRLSNLNRNGFGPLGGGGVGALGTVDLGRSAFKRNTNWGPRVGLAWNPKRFGNRLVVRSGYAWTYDYIFLNPITNLRFSAPFIPSIDFLGPFTGANSFANFVAGTAQAQQSARAAVGVFLATQQNFGTLSPVQQDLKNPKVTHWNFGVEYEFLRDFVLKATYVGTKGEFLQVSLPINLVNPSAIPAPATSEADELNRAAQFQAAFNAESGSAPVGSPLNNRIDPRFNAVTQVRSQGGSLYHAFELQVLKRLRQGYSFQASYTYGHNLDDVSDVLGVLVNDSAAIQDPRNLSLNRANSQFDIRQRFVLNHLWELPFAKNFTGIPGKVLDGWAFSGIFQIQSGFPASILAVRRRTVTDILLVGDSNVRANGSLVGFQPVPDGSPAAALIPGPCSRGVNTSLNSTCTNTSGFPITQPLLGNAGSLARNSLRLAKLVNFDWAILKNTRIREGHTLQFRWEAFNVFNHTNFSGFVNDLTSGSFGTYQSTATDSRRMQGALKYIF